jgi:hypothetical protein
LAHCRAIGNIDLYELYSLDMMLQWAYVKHVDAPEARNVRDKAIKAGTDIHMSSGTGFKHESRHSQILPEVLRLGAACLITPILQAGLEIERDVGLRTKRAKIAAKSGNAAGSSYGLSESESELLAK